ncbi:MAG: hypothetical protein AB3N33_06630 [Puniceicoccaceae bacterium]
MRTALSCILGFLIVTCALAESEVANSTMDLERHIRPGSSDVPTTVTINSFLVDIIDIDDVEGTITMDFFFTQRWQDPRLADDQYDDPRVKLDLTIEDIWHPHLVSIYQRESQLKDALLNIDSAGNVTFRQRGIHTFTAPLDLRQFPFDSQVVDLVYVSSIYSDQELNLVLDRERSGHLGDFSLRGWTFENFEASTISRPVARPNEEAFKLAGLQFDIELKRKPAFYIWKVFFPLGLIAFMAWTVFWIDPANFGGQVAISTSSVITLIAFQLSLSELLPRISYLTNIDIYAIGTSLLVFIALGESILTARLAKIEKHELSLGIDRHMRWIYPLVYALLTLIVVI